jgi:hypothetical protein
VGLRATEQERRLFVSWRDSGGRVGPIGRLARHRSEAGGSYSFTYLRTAAQLSGFEPLPGLPVLHERYESRHLFPVFANRVMPPSRPEFGALAARVDLPGEVDPFEVLARSGGRRATDRIGVFSGPERTADGSSCVLYFAQADGGSMAVNGLRPGDKLSLVDEPRTERTHLALAIETSGGRQVGWLPDYLCAHVHEMRELDGEEPLSRVVRVNSSDAPSHHRLLCRTIAPWPDGYAPFSGLDFRSLA